MGGILAPKAPKAAKVTEQPAAPAPDEGAPYDPQELIQTRQRAKAFKARQGRSSLRIPLGGAPGVKV